MTQQCKDSMARKSVAVIGAGPAGLVSTKVLLEDSYDVTCYDSSSTIGGQWNYEAFKTDSGYQKWDGYDHPIQAVYKSLILNTSRDMSGFSDFPIRDTKKIFLDHWDYRNYLESFCQHFELLHHIKLNCKVTRLSKSKNKWTVHFVETAHDKENGEQYDFVIIASGCFKFPKMPTFKGLSELYGGLVLHTSEIRDGVIFKDKRVLIIGGSHSGFEIAVSTIKYQAAKVFICFTDNPGKRNYWIMNRLNPDSEGHLIPHDYIYTRFSSLENQNIFHQKMKWVYPVALKDCEATLTLPQDRVAITDTDAFLPAVKSSKVEKVGPIDHFECKDVALKDGITLRNIDYVVMGTGFIQKYPFLDEIWKPEDQMKCELYKHILHPDAEMDGLAFVMSGPASGPAFPLMEMQARWICNKVIPRNYGESCELFTAEERQEMLKHIKDTHKTKEKKDIPYNNVRNNFEYVQNLSTEIGCMPPSYEELQKSGDDGKLLAVAVKHGPIIGSHYRLQGPGKWEGAKDWIIEVCQRALGSKKIQEYMNSM